jgi:hypothetical protein
MAEPAAPSEPAGTLCRSGAPTAASPAAPPAAASGRGPGWRGRSAAQRLLRHPLQTPALLGSLLLLAQPAPVAAQAAAGLSQPLGVTPQDRQIFGNGSGSGSGVGPAGSGSGIDINNPIDLINRIRRSTALDDATPPASAVDQALKALEAQSGPVPAGPATGGRSVVSPPSAGGRPAVSGPTMLPGSP